MVSDVLNTVDKAMEIATQPGKEYRVDHQAVVDAIAGASFVNRPADFAVRVDQSISDADRLARLKAELAAEEAAANVQKDIQDVEKKLEAARKRNADAGITAIGTSSIGPDKSAQIAAVKNDTPPSVEPPVKKVEPVAQVEPAEKAKK